MSRVGIPAAKPSEPDSRGEPGPVCWLLFADRSGRKKSLGPSALDYIWKKGT